MANCIALSNIAWFILTSAADFVCQEESGKYWLFNAKEQLNNKQETNNIFSTQYSFSLKLVFGDHIMCNVYFYWFISLLLFIFAPLTHTCPGGEIGRRTVFRSQREQSCAGSNPVLGTNVFSTKLKRHFYFVAWQACLPKRRNENDG